MNKQMIRFVLGTVLVAEGGFLLIPALTAVIYQEHVGWAYIGTAIVCGLLGWLMTHKKPEDEVFYLKEGCLSTALSWILLSVVGALPLWSTGEIPNFVDALFETVSGFTTTGSSVVPEVEVLSHAALMWRSETHFLGGMGVLVFLLAVVPLSGGSNFNLMRAESPGPSVGKLVPQLKATARALYIIYAVLCMIECILLLLGGMSIFDSITTSFATAGTGGFGIYNDSMASVSLYCKWVVAIFMMLFGVNFNAYYLIIFGKVRKALAMEEVKAFISIVVVSTLMIFVSILKLYQNVGDALIDSFFQVTSIMSTTGFATADFDTWPTIAKMVLVFLMFIGACAGSTGGGIKVSRIIICVKTVGKEILGYIHPRSVKTIQLDEKPIEHEVIRGTNTFIMAYVLILVGSIMAVAVDGHDFTTTVTAVIATLNNIGPGLSKVGATCNFAFFSPFSKVVMMFDMLAGRLELFPMLILFHPVIWKDMVTKRKRKIKKKINEAKECAEALRVKE